jgi:hypothetical protein
MSAGAPYKAGEFVGVRYWNLKSASYEWVTGRVSRVDRTDESYGDTWWRLWVRITWGGTHLDTDTIATGNGEKHTDLTRYVKADGSSAEIRKLGEVTSMNNEAYRRRMSDLFAADLGLDPDELFAAANAIWSNLNPDRTDFVMKALSAAGSALAAVRRVQEARA